MQYHVVQYRLDFRSGVWAVIIEDHLIEPYLLSFRLTGLNQLPFLQQALPQLLGYEQISEDTQQTMQFQHDGAPTYYSRNARNYLNVTVVVILCVGLFSHPTYRKGHMKTLVYDTPVDNAQELFARIAVAAGEIRDMFAVFQNSSRSADCVGA